MNKALINNELSLSYPDGFQLMDREELKNAYLDDNPDRWGIRDGERHGLISVWWHESGQMLSSFARHFGGVKSIAKSIEAKLRKGFRRNNYKFGGFFPTQLCGEEAHGLRYEYSVGDIAQYAETIVVQHKNRCYTVYYYARKDGDPSNHRLFEDILSSMSFE
ncbi:MAG: hypothetical protein IJG63_02680 [Oscillospiraceae bacterium]|nr:hypothetical protein [Oscillospiraceae bacterium]